MGPINAETEVAHPDMRLVRKWRIEELQPVAEFFEKKLRNIGRWHSQYNEYIDRYMEIIKEIEVQRSYMALEG